MTVRPERAQGLGRGLAALIPQRSPNQPVTLDISISRIQPNPLQPRKRFDPDGLAALSASIAEHGVLQPIVVTETIDGYQLVAGERRVRAAQAAGLERILREDPTAERAVDPDAALEPHVAGVVASRTEDGGERSFGSHPAS